MLRIGCTWLMEPAKWLATSIGRAKICYYSSWPVGVSNHLCVFSVYLTIYTHTQTRTFNIQNPVGVSRNWNIEANRPSWADWRCRFCLFRLSKAPICFVLSSLLYLYCVIICSTSLCSKRWTQTNSWEPQFSWRPHIAPNIYLVGHYLFFPYLGLFIEPHKSDMLNYKGCGFS